MKLDIQLFLLSNADNINTTVYFTHYKIINEYSGICLYFDAVTWW